MSEGIADAFCARWYDACSPVWTFPGVSSEALHDVDTRCSTTGLAAEGGSNAGAVLTGDEGGGGWRGKSAVEI